MTDRDAAPPELDRALEQLTRAVWRRRCSDVLAVYTPRLSRCRGACYTTLANYITVSARLVLLPGRGECNAGSRCMRVYRGAAGRVGVGMHCEIILRLRVRGGGVQCAV